MSEKKEEKNEERKMNSSRISIANFYSIFI